MVSKNDVTRAFKKIITEPLMERGVCFCWLAALEEWEVSIQQPMRAVSFHLFCPFGWVLTFDFFLADINV